MKLKTGLLLFLSVAFLIAVHRVTQNQAPQSRTLPAAETAHDLPVAAAPAATARENEAVPDWAAAIDMAVTQESGVQLTNLFLAEGLPATAKARLIEAALQRRDGQLMRDAEELLRKMVESGSEADVLAAIPKIVYFEGETAKDIAAMQESLCRFRAQGGDALGFEMIKVKFNMVLGNDPNVRPWSTLCGAS